MRQVNLSESLAQWKNSWLVGIKKNSLSKGINGNIQIFPPPSFLSEGKATTTLHLMLSPQKKTLRNRDYKSRNWFLHNHSVELEHSLEILINTSMYYTFYLTFNHPKCWEGYLSNLCSPQHLSRWDIIAMFQRHCKLKISSKILKLHCLSWTEVLYVILLYHYTYYRINTYRTVIK